jgi:hypothetical protein
LPACPVRWNSYLDDRLAAGCLVIPTRIARLTTAVYLE